MGKNKKLTFAYLNTVIYYHWAFLPWVGAAKTAEKYNANLISFHGKSLRAINDFEEQENVLYDMAKSNRIDGYIIWRGNLTTFLDNKDIDFFFSTFNKPIVVLEGVTPGCPTITFDNYHGMRKVIEHLIEVHHYSKIAFVGQIEDEHNPGFIARYKAYCDAMSEHSLPIDSSFVVPFRWWDGPIDGVPQDTALDAWLKKAISQGLEAVAGLCDPISQWVVEHCDMLGYSVPEDLAVVGFDNNEEGRVMRAPLTTIDPQWEKLGIMAVEKLIDMINGKKMDNVYEVKSKLIIGRSCGCIETNVDQVGQLVSHMANRKEENNNVIIDEMMDALDEKDNVELRNLCMAIYLAIINDKNESKESDFLKNLDKVIAWMEKKDKDILKLQTALTILQKYTHNGSDKTLSQISDLLYHQGRVLIGNASSRQKGYRWMQVELRHNWQRNLGLSLITTFELDNVLELIINNFQKIGTTELYISLFEDPKRYYYMNPAPEWSRLVLAHNKERKIPLPVDGIRYKTIDILPNEFLSGNDSHTWSIKTLYFQETLIGYIIFGGIPQDWYLFEEFRIQLSGSLKGVLLMKKIEKQMEELTHSNEELVHSYEDLQRNQQMLLATEKMASLGRLSSGIAHEMNTPLAAVRAALHELNFLVEEYNNSISNPNVTEDDHREIAKEMKDNLYLAIQSAEKSQGFIKGIKNQSGSRPSTSNINFNATEFIKDTSLVLEHVFKKSKCRLVLKLEGNVILLGNPSAFGQILTNLIVNAVDACSPDGGTVTVSLYSDPNKANILAVEDTGSGISEENLKKIFEPFFTTKPFGKGTGLGLAIVYDLVNEFGAKIDCESEPGRTVFMINFPFKPGV